MPQKNRPSWRRQGSYHRRNGHHTNHEPLVYPVDPTDDTDNPASDDTDRHARDW